MEFLGLERLLNIQESGGYALWLPIQKAPWMDWDGFWLPYVLGDRFMIIYCLPLVLLLRFLPRRHLRIGIIATSLVFLGYLFGAIYPLIWLLMCIVFYYLSERFTIESKRTDVVRWGPPLAAILCVGGWYVASMILGLIGMGVQRNNWLFEHYTWIYPLSARLLSGAESASPPQLMFAIFIVPQMNGIVIFTIRMMHYFSELKRDTIPRERRTLINFVAFASFAPTILQGPIERFNDFQEGLAHCHEHRSWRDVLAGLFRIGMGLSKSVICICYLAPPLFKIVLKDGYFIRPEQIESYAVLFFCLHLQVLAIYLHFSGYCDVAVGLARLLGYRAVENFKRPWLATSLTDMWRRWHISFSFILRDYIFTPLVRRRWNVTVSLVVTFVVCALLHNFNLNYIIWGIVMGLMVAVNQKWARWMRNLDRHPQWRLSAIRRGWLKLQPLPRVCAWAVTINAFVLTALACFGGLDGWRVGWELIRRPLLGLLQACGLDPPVLH